MTKVVMEGCEKGKWKVVTKKEEEQEGGKRCNGRRGCVRESVSLAVMIRK